MGLLVGSNVQGRSPEPVLAPRVVGKGGIKSATAATAATPILRVDQTGFYRINIMLWTTTGGDAITVTGNVVITDRVGAVTVAVTTALSLNATGRTGAVFPFEANKGTTISWSTTLSGGRVLSVHDVKVILERMEDA